MILKLTLPFRFWIYHPPAAPNGLNEYEVNQGKNYGRLGTPTGWAKDWLSISHQIVWRIPSFHVMVKGGDHHVHLYSHPHYRQLLGPSASRHTEGILLVPKIPHWSINPSLPPTCASQDSSTTFFSLSTCAFSL